MNLAFCLFKYYPYGGLERDFMRIAMECMNRGHEVHVYTMRWSGEVPAGFIIHLIPVKAFSNHARCRKFVAKLQIKLTQNKHDLIIGFNRMPGLDVYYAADNCFRKTVQKKHGAWYRLTPRYKTYASFENAIFSPASKTQILSLCSAQQQQYQTYYATPTARFYQIPAGIDKERILVQMEQSKEQLREALGFKEIEFLLLMVGSDFKRKGVDRAFKALAALPASYQKITKLILLGKGKEKPFLQLAEKLKISDKILFLGASNEVGKYLRAADLLIHPAYQETAGMVLLEALVAGLPVLVTENCGYSFHIAQAKAGNLVPMPFDQEILNQNLLSMLDKSKLAEYSKNAVSYSQATDFYSLPATAADLFEGRATVRRHGSPGLLVLEGAAIQTHGCSFISNNKILLSSVLCSHIGNEKQLEKIFALQGEVYRHEKNRKTFRIELNNQGYFVKLHTGVGWKEILKNLFQGRLPVLGAKQEWQAIARLTDLGIPTMKAVGFGSQGLNPARTRSFLITEELTNMISLEDYCKSWTATPPEFQLKRKLIKRLAQIARTLHLNGLNHRDFYLCHFLLDNSLDLFLIDLHRVQIRNQTPVRWKVKDLAGLYFSSMEIGLNSRDFLWFIKQYSQASIKKELKFWLCVKTRADKLYEKIHGTRKGS